MHLSEINVNNKNVQLFKDSRFQENINNITRNET